MVRIRLARVGSIRQPSYRVVVSDQRSPRNGRFIEIVGNYNPRTDPETVVIDRERVLYWLERGAQPSEAVARLLEQTSVMAIRRGETTLEEVLGAETAQA
ncbi:MAG: 30S ribosomal protein S16 [Anaerolineae bacterium]|jgi:small subunit ribosomal protein S16|nr:30S ribosomal protein S16 [Chloroflexota bacterium]